MTFQETLKAWRLDRGIGYAAAGVWAGKGERVWWRWENRDELPQIEDLRRVTTRAARRRDFPRLAAALCLARLRRYAPTLASDASVQDELATILMRHFKGDGDGAKNNRARTD